MEIIIVPPIIWRTGNIPATPVVGDNHAGVLQRSQDHLILWEKEEIFTLALSSKRRPMGGRFGSVFEEA